jgi:glutaryl-CoA dehydrogenase
MWITNATIADAAIVWARTDEGVKGFIVEKDMPGFDTQEIENKFSLRASVTGALFFDNVRVPKENVLPGVSTLRGPLSCLTQARYGISWGVIGAAQACLDEALKYTQDRVLFGQPLSHTQTIQIRLAEMARQITTAQLLYGTTHHDCTIPVAAPRPDQGQGRIESNAGFTCQVE